jgi:hypothetical protein
MDRKASHHNYAHRRNSQTLLLRREPGLLAPWPVAEFSRLRDWLWDVAMVMRRNSRHSKWRAAIVFGALSAVAVMVVPELASAQGFFDFLFGGSRQQPAPPGEPNPYPPSPEGVGRVAPAPLGQESVNQGNDNTGHSVAFCVRLCDGQHFPMEQMANGTPVETCRAICPYSKTKVFFGTEIGGAVAQDGQHYATLDTAFVYRKQLVANCTCNGKDAFGLAALDAKNDPTLRPGDIVSTKDGLVAFTGKSGAAAAFTPVNPATLPADIRPGSPQLQLPPSATPTADDELGTIVPRQNAQPKGTPAGVSPQGQNR